MSRGAVPGIATEILMTPILFYGVPEGCSFGSIVALEWLGRPYRLCRVAMPEVVSGEDFRRLNTVGETPTLLTADGRLLSQSLAILNHIGAQAPDGHLGHPQGSPGFDRLNERLAFLNTSFFDAFSPLWHVREHDSRGAEREVLTAHGRALVARAHGQLESLLGGRDWLSGDGPGLADAYFTGIARWADVHQAVDRRDYPAVQRLFARLQEEPAVRFAHAIEHGEPAAGSGGFEGEISLDEALGLARQAA